MLSTRKKTEAIRLKALVDIQNNRVIFAEPNADFIDVLLSLLTMPMGTIIRLTRQPPATRIGCMNNLYESVENLDKKYFQTEACKIMLLNPQNGTAAQCKSLKLKIDNSEPLRYFLCSSSICALYEHRLLSHYRNMRCSCGNPMNSERILYERKKNKTVIDAQDGGVFVKGKTELLISDELRVIPSTFTTSSSLVAKHGVMSTIEEKFFDIGVNEVLKLLKCSFVSKTPLTETLLKQKTVTELSKNDFDQGSFIKSHIKEKASNENGICVKLIVCKSKQMVSYAEVGQDFVDLLFSFLTLPLGYIVKYTHGCSLNGCINHLYDSVQDLDTEHYFKSNDHKAMLVSPKLAPGFSYENQPLGIGEYLHLPYYYRKKTKTLTSDETLLQGWKRYSKLSVMDPKTHYNKAASGGGYVTGEAKLKVTDDLIITPMSQTRSLSSLNKLEVPFSDFEERIEYVGNEEALRLLVASFVSKSALTNTFILREPTQEIKKMHLSSLLIEGTE